MIDARSARARAAERTRHTHVHERRRGRLDAARLVVGPGAVVLETPAAAEVVLADAVVETPPRAPPYIPHKRTCRRISRTASATPRRDASRPPRRASRL